MKLIEFYALVGIGFYLVHQFAGRDIGKDGKEQKKT